MIILRDYQKECIEKIMSMKNREKKIVYLPTGSGKSVLIAEICKRVNGRILIIVINKEIREQIIDKLKLVCGDNVSVGSVQGNTREWNARIVVATRQTLTYGNKIKDNISKLLENNKISHVLIDEAHIAINQQKTILENLNKDICLIGFTATPYSLSMRKIYNGFVYKRELIDMIKEGYLVEPICYQINSSTNLNDVKVVKGDFVKEQLSKAINTDYRNNLIVRSYIDKCQVDNRNKTIVFCSTVEHSKSLAECFNKNGIKAMSIDGSCKKKDREKILKDFHEGNFQVLCNVNILTTGFDEPTIDSIIFARCTLSKMLYIQMLGRGLRLSPETGKKDCLVVDIVDVIEKHNIITSKTIFDVQNGETLTKAIKRKTQEKINKEEIENLEKNILESTNNLIEEIKEQEKNINLNNLNITYEEKNIFENRNVKENFGRVLDNTNDKKESKEKDTLNQKDKNKENNKKTLISGILGKIFKFSF